MHNSILNGPSRSPASGMPARQAIVFLHGYGADGNDLISLTSYFAESLPDAAFFSPHAPEQFELSSIGRQWFSLQGYDPNLFLEDQNLLANTLKNMYEGAEKSAVYLSNYLDHILTDLNLRPDALALVGFSQGTMMAMHVGLQRSPAFGAIVGFSGALLGGEYLAKEGKSKPPILLVHGETDEVVPISAFTEMQRVLDSQNIEYFSHVIPNHGHGIEQIGLRYARSFLSQNLIGESSDQGQK